MAWDCQRCNGYGGYFTYSDIEQFLIIIILYLQIRTCDICQRTNRKLTTGVPELHPIKVHSPWYHLGIQRGEFVQVLNVAGNHWITVSNMWCQPGEVNIYDSIRSRVVSTRTRDQIAAILFSQRQKITLTISAVQEQRGSSDCGLFALAYATSLCSGEHPAQVNYVQHMFRNHLLTCLQRRQITPFPSTTRPRKLLKS